MPQDYWLKLQNSVSILDAICSKHHVQLRPGEGLHEALEEARRLVQGVRTPGCATEQEVVARASQANTIITLADTLGPLDAAGFPISRYLKQPAAGTTDDEVPQASGEKKKDFFKSFEAELFVLSSLHRAHLPVKLQATADDPAGEMEVDGVIIEVKHPESTNQLKKLLKKFNRQLARRSAFGVVVIGLEDAFSTAPHAVHVDPAAQTTAVDGPAKNIDALARNLLPAAARLPKIAACVTLRSRQELIGGVSSFSRHVNAVILDEQPVPRRTWVTVKAVCGVFARPPELYSVLKSTPSTKQ